MPENGDKTVRINIYVHDPQIRRRVKEAAAREGQSMSEYCLDAIVSKLTGYSRGATSPVNPAERARRFREKVFDGKLASVSAAELVRESRERH